MRFPWSEGYRLRVNHDDLGVGRVESRVLVVGWLRRRVVAGLRRVGRTRWPGRARGPAGSR